MAVSTDVQHADDLSHRRARTLPVVVVIYLSQQFSYFSSSDTGGRGVDHLRTASWVILSLLLLACLATKGFWFRSRDLRDLIDDEFTQRNRHDALRWGYLTTIGSAIVLYVLQEFQPLTVPEAIHTLVSLGLGIAILRFALLERRAHRG